MGFLDRTFRSREQDGEEDDYYISVKHKELEKEEPEIEEPEFVADISMFELERANWVKFAGMLKQKRILPNSYIKKPADVKVQLGKNGRPMILLTFNSATSSSVREFMLLQDGVFQSVNGAIDDGKNKELNDLWKHFQETIRYGNYINTRKQGYVHKMRGEKMMEVAKKLMGYNNFYDLEQEFLEKYKDAIFDDFCYGYLEKNPPEFIPLEPTVDGHYISGDGVVPFSPKTLEFCISKMTNGCKIENGEYLDNFEDKCKKIQELSCFESEDWDKVIGYGKDIVKTAYQVSVLENQRQR